MTSDETVDLVSKLADVARAKGIRMVGAGNVTLEMGAPPAAPEEPLTEEQREARAKAAAVAAVRERLRKMLGRNPTDEEVADFGGFVK